MGENGGVLVGKILQWSSFLQNFHLLYQNGRACFMYQMGALLAYALSQKSSRFDRLSSMSLILKPFTLFNSRVWSQSPISAYLCSSQFTKGDFRVCFKTAKGLLPTILMLQLLFLLNRSSSNFFYSLIHVPAFVFIFLLDCSKGIDEKFSIQNSFVNVAVANWDFSIMPTFSNVTYVK